MTPTLSPDVPLDRILGEGALSAVFQPIFDVTGGGLRLHAVEALVRGPKGTNVENPEVLFDYVRRMGQEARADRVCVTIALDAARHLPLELDMSLNVHASTLARDLEFAAFICDSASSRGIAPSRLIVEVVEHAPPYDIPPFRQSVDALRALSVRIALDDVGRGHSNYLMMLACRPEYFKIDRYFVDGAHADFHRLAVIESVTLLAEKFGGRVVAEGVEDAADLRAVLGVGVQLVQGHLFLRAVPAEQLGCGEATLHDFRPSEPQWPQPPGVAPRATRIGL